MTGVIRVGGGGGVVVGRVGLGLDIGVGRGVGWREGWGWGFFALVLAGKGPTVLERFSGLAVGRTPGSLVVCCLCVGWFREVLGSSW